MAFRMVVRTLMLRSLTQESISYTRTALDAVAIAHGKPALDAHYIDPIDRARISVVSTEPHAGDWLNALPVASCGLRLG